MKKIIFRCSIIYFYLLLRELFIKIAVLANWVCVIVDSLVRMSIVCIYVLLYLVILYSDFIIYLYWSYS